MKYNLTHACPQELATILDFLRFAVSCAEQHSLFYGHGTDNALSDMTALIAGSLKLPFEDIVDFYSAKLTKVEKDGLYAMLVKRIVHNIPVPYLTHEAYFCGLPFYVDERVLIPRSPIGELIEQQFSPWLDAPQVQNILDLCTGSGCIAIACAHYFPEAWVDAIDISPDALEVARVNHQRYNLDEQVRFIESDAWAEVPDKRYDLIVSNPPYVGECEMQTLPAEYQHEPVLALQAPDNGLAIVHRILQRASDYLTQNGILVVEVGNSADALQEAYPDLPFMWLEFARGGTGVFMLTYDQLAAYFVQPS